MGAWLMNRKGVLVYSLEELKALYPNSGTKGMWAFHANYHTGHERCANEAQRCDWVVGILYNNMADGEKWMTGTTSLKTYPITKSDIDILKKYSDVVLILTGEYHPYKQYWSQIQNEFDKQFPKEFLKEKDILEEQDTFNILLYSVAIRFLLHGVFKMHFDYHAQCGKDRFRTIGYTDYVLYRWGVSIDLIDSVRDQYGNSFSKTISCLPKELKDRINKPLLSENFFSIEDVQEHINDIFDLKVLYFHRMNGWVHATFEFEGYKSWVEGIRCKL